MSSETPTERLDVNGMVAVVTGGAGGIGKGIVTALLQRGATVVIADIEADTSTDALLRSATQLLRERFGIRHVTIQPEVTRVHGDGDSCQILAT